MGQYGTICRALWMGPGHQWSQINVSLRVYVLRVKGPPTARDRFLDFVYL